MSDKDNKFAKDYIAQEVAGGRLKKDNFQNNLTAVGVSKGDTHWRILLFDGRILRPELNTKIRKEPKAKAKPKAKG